MQKIFFYHMPKAGGTSIRSALHEGFEASRIAPIIENDVLGHENNAGKYHPFRGFDLYSGHYGVDIHDAVADGHLPMSNFRHPVSRIYSLYRYFRAVDVSESDLKQRHYATVRLAKETSFADFISSDDEIVAIYISDQQARQLTGSPWSPQRAIDLDAARKRIDALAWFYICENPVKSLAWLRDVLGITSIPVLNVSPQLEIPEEAEECATVILKRNRADLALYEYAVDQLHQRQR